MQPARNKCSALPWFPWLKSRNAKDLSARSKKRRKCTADSAAANDLLEQINADSESASSLASQPGALQTVAESRSALSLGLFRLPGFLSTPESKDSPRRQEAPYPQEAQASALSVNQTSADSGSAVVMIEGESSTPGPEALPRTPLSVKVSRTWFLLLAMIGAFFLWFWMVQPMVYLEVGGVDPDIKFTERSLVPAVISEDDVNDYDGRPRSDASGSAGVGNTTLRRNSTLTSD